MSDEFELLVHRQALHGQGLLWIRTLNGMQWVDILRRELHTYHRDSGFDEVTVLPGTVTALAATLGGQLVAATDSGFALVYPGRAALEPIAEIENADRMNAGTCDPAGRFVAGTLTHARHPGKAAMYMLDGARSRVLVDGLTFPNGVAWNPSGTRMYLVDTTSRTIWLYDYDVHRGRATSGRRWVICAEAEGSPNGIAVDADANVWVAMHGTGRIQRYKPNGDLDTILWAPTRRITDLAFGGPRLDEMYVTSACFGYDERALLSDPYAGSVLCFRPGATGLPAAPWRGL